MPNPAPLRAPSGASAPSVDALTPHLFEPTARRPLRAKTRYLPADTHVLPHSHAWAQIALSTEGVVRLTAARGTYIVPPSRALWIPPGVEHAVTMVDAAHLHTLYLYQPRGRSGPGGPGTPGQAWQQCRVLEVSALLHALVRALDTTPDSAAPPSPEALRRERHISALVLDELRRARAVPLGVALPRDKRLRHLCEAVLDDPTRHATLQGWAQDSGASPRTVARLFRQELGSSFTQWRQQVVLAKAVALAAARTPMGQIAAELGYNPSAFSAMVRRTVGMPPGRFLGQQRGEAAVQASP